MSTVAARGRGLEASKASQWWPGLEGMRGLGLIVLLLHHHDETKFVGGFLSVSMFFTLSGFLITSLLLREHGKGGRIDVARFWARRVRRLLPMAMFGLLLATVVAYATRPASLLPPVADDIRWAALNLANWRFISTDTSYAEIMSAPSTVSHYWSLAIEEQYYLVYPVIAGLALRFRTRVGLGLLLGGVTIASIAAQLLGEGGDRAYYGTDTRLAEIAIGGLAAVLWTGWVKDALRPGLDVIGAIAAIGAGVMWVGLPLDSDVVWRGGVVLHAVLISMVVVAVVDGQVVRRFASWEPLVWLGGLSYGTYIVHLPLYLYLDADRVGIDGPGLLAIRVAASLGLAAGMRILLERPIRFGGAFPAWQAPVAAFTLMGAVLVGATALPEVGRKGNALEEFVTERRDAPGLVTAPVPEVVELPSTTLPAGSSSTVAGAVTTTTAPAEQPRALKLLTAGDSTAGVWGDGMQQWGAGRGLAAVDRTGGPGCVFYQEGKAYLRPGWVFTSGCDVLPDLIVQDVGRSKPDALILIIGSLELADWRQTDDSPPVGFGDPGFDARYRAAFDRALDRFSTELSIPILVATIPVPDWDPANAPGSGPLTTNDEQRTRRLNEINRAVVAEHPRARMVDFAGAVSLPNGHVDPALHPDGIHIDEGKVPRVMDAGLADQLRAAYRSVIAADPSLRRPGATMWFP